MSRHSFSIKEADEETEELILQLKERCKVTGQSFSFVVIKALKALLREDAHDPKR